MGKGDFAALVSLGHPPSSEEGNFHLSFVDAWYGPHDGPTNRHMHFLQTLICKKQFTKINKMNSAAIH